MKKKKKKKKKLDKILKAHSRVKIFDDDVDLKHLLPDNLGNTLEEDVGDDDPTIAEIIDDRPEHVKREETYGQDERWKTVGRQEDDDRKNGNRQKSGCRHDSDSDQSPTENNRYKESYINTKRCDSNSDHSPVRRNRHDSDSDCSPVNKSRHNSDSDKSSSIQNRHDSDSDQSPVRQNRHDSDADQSPIRQSRHDSDSDQSRVRPQDSNNKYTKGRNEKRKKINSNLDDSDQSPPRRQRHKSDSDQSPPRKHHQGVDSDQSPPKHAKRQKNPSDSDQSPPRRKIHKSDSDQSPQRRKKHKSDSDQSPPRKQKHNQETNKERKHIRRDESVSRKGGQPTGRSGAKPKKTLSGAKAGLSSAKDVRSEIEALRKQHDSAFKKIDENLLGRSAETVFRDRKTGKRRNIGQEQAEQDAENAKKKEEDAKYERWGKGVKQQSERDQLVTETIHEMSKPLARSRDDSDLDAMMRQMDRDGDPMAAFITKKQTAKKNERPQYKGPFPPNRFGIRPGYRWDGVDRSTGFEKQLFAKMSDRRATKDMAYKWSTEDM